MALADGIHSQRNKVKTLETLPTLICLPKKVRGTDEWQVISKLLGFDFGCFWFFFFNFASAKLHIAFWEFNASNKIISHVANSCGEEQENYLVCRFLLFTQFVLALHFISLPRKSAFLEAIMLIRAQRRTWCRRVACQKRCKRGTHPFGGPGGVWGVSVGEGERGQSPPCQHRSEETQEHSGSGGESPVSLPRTSWGAPQALNVCSDIPKCPGEHRGGISRCWWWNRLSLQPKAAGRHLSLGVMWDLEPHLRGLHSTVQRKNIHCSQILTAIASRASRDHREQGRYHCRPNTNPESSPRLPCCSQATFSPDYEDAHPDIPSCHLGKEERSGSLRANGHPEGLIQTERDS